MVGLAITGMSHYIASKMGIIGFMRGLANDVANDGITANAVLPGLTNTLAIAPQSEEQKRVIWEQQAIKRLGEPRDVTGAVLFLQPMMQRLSAARQLLWTAVSIALAKERKANEIVSDNQDKIRIARNGDSSR